MEEIKLNKEQAQSIAFAIFADIEAYVNEHSDEFEEFLKSEEKEN